MVGATILAVGVAVWAEHRRKRRVAAEGASGPEGDGPRLRSPMSPLAAAGLTLFGVLVVAYLILVAVKSN